MHKPATFALLLVALPVWTFAVADKEVAAKEAASEWIALIDAGRYDAALNAAAPTFSENIKREDWHKGLADVRKPLGAVHKRSVQRLFATYLLPGAPEGDYIIVNFRTRFADQEKAVDEIVVTSFEPDASDQTRWQVVGYYLQ